MRTSEQVDKIVAALFAFQNEVTPPPKNQDNPFFKSKYADLPSLFDHCKPLMKKNGLLFTSVGLTSRIFHTSGQWIEGDFKVETSQMSAQQVGAAETYGRRYSFQGLLGICAEEDDDGNAASHKPANHAGPKLSTKPGGPVGGFPKPSPKPDAVGIVAAPDDERPPLRDEDNPEAIGAEDLELCTLKAFSKEKTDKKNNIYRGVLLVHADQSEKWWNLYHAETMGQLLKLKEKQVYAKLEMKGEYPLCHNLTAVSA